MRACTHPAWNKQRFDMRRVSQKNQHQQQQKKKRLYFFLCSKQTSPSLHISTYFSSTRPTFISLLRCICNFNVCVICSCWQSSRYTCCLLRAELHHVALRLLWQSEPSQEDGIRRNRAWCLNQLRTRHLQAPDILDHILRFTWSIFFSSNQSFWLFFINLNTIGTSGFCCITNTCFTRHSLKSEAKKQKHWVDFSHFWACHCGFFFF